MNWWQRLRNREQLERDLDDELQDHLERSIAEHIEAGASEQDARRRARLELGGRDQVKEISRDARGTRWVEDVLMDVRFSVRLLLKERWFTVSAVLALALGIAVPSMMATIINGYYFRGLPVDDPDRILSLATRDAAGRTRGVSYQDYQDWRAAARSFASLAAFAPAMMTVSEQGQSPENLGGAYVSADAFDILGVAPILGRGLLASDDRPGAPPVVTLGFRLWTTRYGGDPGIIGRSIQVNGATATAVGVMPEGFEFPFRHAVWQTLAMWPGIERQRRDDRVLGVFGRIAEGAGLTQARTELASIATALARNHPDTNAGIEPTAVKFGEQQVGRFGDTLPPMALLVMAAFVFLIACANVANLFLARAAGRAREMATRAAVGATRGRIVRQLLVESLLLAGAAGALGLWLSTFGVRFVTDAFGRNVPYWMRFAVDGRVLLVLVTLCFVSTLLCGLAPALFVSKTDVNGVMKEGGRTAVAPGVRRWTGALLVAELALTLMLLAGAGLMVRSFLALYRVDRLIDPSRVLTVELDLPERKYPLPQQRADFHARLDERLRTMATGSPATVVSARPFSGAAARMVSFDGRADMPGETPPSVSTLAIGPLYFDALRLSLIQGRAFTDRDGTRGHDVAIVNTRFAGIHYPGQNALGQRIRLRDRNADAAAGPWFTIVGVSPTIRQSHVSANEPVVYLPLRSHTGSSAAVIVGHLSDPASATPTLRREVASLDPEVIVFNATSLREVLDDSRLEPRLMGTLLGAFAAIAALLSTLGLYAVTAYAVLQRTREVGIRMALGARAAQVMWLFVGRVLVTLALGLAIGLVGSFVVGRLLQGLLIQTSATDPVTVVSIVSFLVLIAVAASVVPARRAARLDPLAVLRND